MGTNVVSLPDRMERQWRVYESNIQELMRENGIDADVGKVALARVKPIYLRCAKSHAIPHVSDPEAVLQEVNRWASQLGTGLLMEIILREVALINLRGEGS